MGSKQRMEFDFEIDLFNQGIWHILRFISEFILVPDRPKSSVHTDIGKCLYSDELTSSIRRNNIHCYGASRTFGNV